MSAFQESPTATLATSHSHSNPARSQSLPRSPPSDDASADDSAAPGTKAAGKRRLFGLGKNKGVEKGAAEKTGGPTSSPPSSDPAMSSTMASPKVRHASVSPHGSPHARGSVASPPPRYRSTSPAMRSPASSQIFERNVQESTLSGEMASPAIPAHIQTEDHIPPVLEASSFAITDDHLGPDEVEIVMHAAHQSAAVTVPASNAGDSIASPTFEETSIAPSVASATVVQQEPEDSGSTYGTLDAADVRRLSFISFADVVQSEHVEPGRDATHLMSLSSTTANRSPSPVRSPASLHDAGTSPPASGAASVQGMESSQLKTARVPASPTHTSGSPPMGGELTIETMRQALHKTGSGDMSGPRSPPLSAASPEEPSTEQSFK